MKNNLKGLVLALALSSVIATPTFAETVTTDGNNPDSPVKIYATKFKDYTFGTPGPKARITFSTKIKNTSEVETLKNVKIKLQLKNTRGKVAKEWEGIIPSIPPGAVVKYSNPGNFINQIAYNPRPHVVVIHDALSVTEELDEEELDEAEVDAENSGEREVKLTPNEIKELEGLIGKKLTEEDIKAIEKDLSRQINQQLEQEEPPAWIHEDKDELKEDIELEDEPTDFSPERTKTRFTTAPNASGTGSINMQVDQTKQPWD